MLFRSDGDDTYEFQTILNEQIESPFYILRTEKGYGGPNRHQEAHQVPLKEPRTDFDELKRLEEWLLSYKPDELLDEEKGLKV